MLELALFILCILGLCGVVSVKPICIVGIIQILFHILEEVLRKMNEK